MRVQAGKLDRKLELLADSVVTDEYGQEIASYAVVATIYGQRLEMRTQDAARAGGRDTFAVARYLVRHRAAISTAMRVRIAGTVYDILAIDEPDRGCTLILTLEEAKG